MVARCPYCDRQYWSGYMGYPVTVQATRIAAFTILARMEAEREAR